MDMLKLREDGEEGIATMLMHATQAFQAKSVICRRLARKSELVDEMHRDALIADWDKLLADIK